MIILNFCLWWYIIEGIYLWGMERRLRVIQVCVLDIGEDWSAYLSP